MSSKNVIVFDTSDKHIAAALYRGRENIKTTVESMSKGQAERLIPLLNEILDEAFLSWEDIHRIGVCTGPGNFTGIRISVSAARGLAFGLNIPAIGISSFEATLYGSGENDLAILPANKGFYYVGSNPKNATFASEDFVRSMHKTFIHKSEPETLLKNIALLTQEKNQNFKPPTPCYIKPADASPNAKNEPQLLK